MPAGRLTGWVGRYAATHPGLTVTAGSGGLALLAEGGSTAALRPLVPYTAEPGATAEELVAGLAAHACRPIAVGLLLVRRGGFAVGIARAGALERSKVGSRYVQSRTAAGGWSQQRFARRREGQAKELVRAAADAWAELPDRPPVSVLVTGGDRSLCEQVLGLAPLRALREVGVARHLDVTDPRLVVLKDAAARTQALLVTVVEP